MMQIKFVPSEDITAYELAQIYAKAGAPLKSIMIEREQWDALPYTVQRHFLIERWSE